MKAAVLSRLGSNPSYNDYIEPTPLNDDQLVMTVKAASIKNIDKLRAGGNHYASYKELPVIVGLDAVGSLPDGKLVYAQGITGTIAEKALISKFAYTPLPDKIDLALAAALPNAVIGSAMALKFRAAIKKGENVLINGATGVTGQIAVQLAKHYGAGKIFVTGRNQEILSRLHTLGADEIISLKNKDTEIIAQIKEIHSKTPIDIVIDYLWGHPIEIIIDALKGGGVNMFNHRVRLVTVGSMAGEQMSLSSATLRSSSIEILGSGLGSFTQAEMKLFGTEILPEMFALAAAGKLTMDIETATLIDIEQVWNKQMKPGRRMVILIRN